MISRLPNNTKYFIKYLFLSFLFLRENELDLTFKCFYLFDEKSIQDILNHFLFRTKWTIFWRHPFYITDSLSETVSVSNIYLYNFFFLLPHMHWFNVAENNRHHLARRLVRRVDIYYVRSFRRKMIPSEFHSFIHCSVFKYKNGVLNFERAI